MCPGARPPTIHGRPRLLHAHSTDGDATTSAPLWGMPRSLNGKRPAERTPRGSCSGKPIVSLPCGAPSVGPTPRRVGNRGPVEITPSPARCGGFAAPEGRSLPTPTSATSPRWRCVSIRGLQGGKPSPVRETRVPEERPSRSASRLSNGGSLDSRARGRMFVHCHYTQRGLS
jgi:hypothetical protein